MINSRQLIFFTLRFVLCFGLLIFPWPGFQVSTVYRAGVRVVVGVYMPHRKVIVENFHDSNHPSVDTKISIIEEHRDGSSLTKAITNDSRSMAWMPLAMFCALCGATPVKWMQRLKMLAAGIGGVLVFVAATVMASVLPATQGQSTLSIVAYHLLVENIWMSFVGPFLLWVLCLFRFCGGTFNHFWEPDLLGM